MALRINHDIHLNKIREAIIDMSVETIQEAVKHLDLKNVQFNVTAETSVKDEVDVARVSFDDGSIGVIGG